mmetsp:Transcript_1319/g.2822  ORF Transcript_1319/g.2822 Transcript_1319/m.2822 type:complete len:269 (+) Transcript_1319:1423-2229(+)
MSSSSSMSAKTCRTSPDETSPRSVRPLDLRLSTTHLNTASLSASSSSPGGAPRSPPPSVHADDVTSATAADSARRDSSSNVTDGRSPAETADEATLQLRTARNPPTATKAALVQTVPRTIARPPLSSYRTLASASAAAAAAMQTTEHAWHDAMLRVTFERALASSSSTRPGTIRVARARSGPVGGVPGSAPPPPSRSPATLAAAHCRTAIRFRKATTTAEPSAATAPDAEAPRSEQARSSSAHPSPPVRGDMSVVIMTPVESPIARTS